MQNGRWIGFSFAGLLAAGALGSSVMVGCGSTNTNGSSADAGTDQSAGGDGGGVSSDAGMGTGTDGGGGQDSGPGSGDGGSGGPNQTLAKAFLVQAASVAPPLRFCFGLGNPDAGVVIFAPYPAEPDMAAPGQPIPGMVQGMGGAIDSHMYDLSSLTLSVYAIDATTLTQDVGAGADGGAAEKQCGDLLGTGMGGTTSSGVMLKPNVNFWYLGSIPSGTLAHGTTWVAGVVGCTANGTAADQALRCPNGFTPGTSDLSLQLWQVDSTTVVDGGSLGVQFLQASVAWDKANAAGFGAAQSALGVFEPPPASTDAGAGGGMDAASGDGSTGTPTDAGTDATTDAGTGMQGDGGIASIDAGAASDGSAGVDSGTMSGPARPITIPLVGNAKFGDVKPSPLQAVSGATFDMNSGVFAQPLAADGGPTAAPPGLNPLAIPFPVVQQLSGMGDAGTIGNGGSFVFVLVGDPSQPPFIGSDGGAMAQDAGGHFNLGFTHFLGFPSTNQ